MLGNEIIMVVHSVFVFRLLQHFPHFEVKRTRESKLAQRAKEERWATYSYKRGIQQLADALEDSANQSKGVELLKNAPCEALEWKDGKCLVCLIITMDRFYSKLFQPVKEADQLAFKLCFGLQNYLLGYNCNQKC